ncbi:endothelial lipase-like [Planococcus citri]|uniref:endothelial lipase-like n=1 Tax=Planococcus citri TaxID=170843 RepID=UPI0031F733E3
MPLCRLLFKGDPYREMMLRLISLVFIVILVIEVEKSNCESPKCPKPITTCERGKISFYLFKELLEPYEELILYDENSIKNAPFIPKADFKILIHGYTGSKDRPQAMVDLRNEYLKLQKKFNIVVVDWGPMAVDGCYFDTAFHCISLVGGCLAELVNSILHYRPEITVDQFHVIGWSMGAQVCARFGGHFWPKIVPRITGLDPALPKFEWPYTAPHNILNRRHAKFVDVLHSNMGICGVYFSDAHYDIYLNKGTFQPGCGDNISCSHARATEAFTESINSKVKFMARKCDTNSYYVTFRSCNGDSKKYIEVGEYCKPPADEKDTGTYFLKTNDQSPLVKPIAI